MSNGISSGVKTSVGGATSSTSIPSPSRSLYEGFAPFPFTSTSSFSIRRCKRARLQPSICEARYESKRAPTWSGPILKLRSPSAIAAFEIFHKRYEGFDSGARKRVVDGRANATDGSVSLQAVESLRGCFGGKLFLELFRRQAEGDIHRRTTISVSMTAIKIRRIDSVVNQLRFLVVLTFHSREAALVLQPFANEVHDVNAPRVWRVVERFVLDVNAIVKHRR